MQVTQRFFSTRGGTLGLAGFAALLAAVSIFAYVQNYRNNVKKGGALASVLVVKGPSPIQKGTPGEAIAGERLFQVKQIRESQLREGALSDPASLRGRVAATDIYPNEQLTASDFTSSSAFLSSKLVRDQRAIAVSIDAAHGIIGNLHVGDHVDVYAAFNVQPIGATGAPVAGGTTHSIIRMIIQDAPVLALSGGSGGQGTSIVTLRGTTQQALDIGFTSDNGRLWFVLRPPNGAVSPPPPSLATAETVLLGVPPIQELHLLGGRR
jgi:Flp pilus assembly protein CpaB